MPDFLGTSLAFPLRPDGRGGLAISFGAQAVEDSLRAIILSPKGSHQIEKWFGLPLFIFEPMPSVAAASEAIRDAIVDGDDRVDPDTLEVDVTVSDSGEVNVLVQYSIKGDSDARTLAVGFRALV